MGFINYNTILYCVFVATFSESRIISLRFRSVPFVLSGCVSLAYCYRVVCECAVGGGSGYDGYWRVSKIETTPVNMVLVFIPGTVWNRLGGKEPTAVPCGF